MDWWMLIKAFAVGGGICVVGQLLIDLTKLTPARILVAFVVAGVALTAVGLYEPLINFAGAGASIPLTGFGYALAKGVEEGVAHEAIRGEITDLSSKVDSNKTASIAAISAEPEPLRRR